VFVEQDVLLSETLFIILLKRKCFVCRDDAVHIRGESPSDGFKQNPIRKSDEFILKHPEGES